MASSTESLLLAAAGGVAGVAGAYTALQMLMKFGGSRLPRLETLGFDWTTVGFATVLVAVTGLVVGIVPALRMADGDIAPLMNDSGRSVRGSGKTRRLLAFFVVAELAVAVALVAGAARLVSSYRHIEGIDPGFDPGGRLVLDVLLPNNYMAQTRRNAWWEATRDRLRSAGAVRVASASSLPLQPELDTTTFIDLVSRPDIPPDQRPNGRRRLVSADFFRTMGIRVRSGRDFTDADGPATMAVGIVNEAFVRRSLDGADPLGERMKGLKAQVVAGRVVPEDVVIVGVVADVRYASLTTAAEPIVYLPKSQHLSRRELIVVTTADGRPHEHVAALRAAVTAVDATIPVEVGTMTTFVAASLDRQRLGMWLMSGFGIAALLLAMVGIFGVIAYVVAQRTGEMAVRQALGATGSQIVLIVVKDAGRAAAFGLVGGLLIAWWMGTLMARYVYEVRAGDLLILAGSATLVALVAVLATLVPATRVAAGELSKSLRQG